MSKLSKLLILGLVVGGLMVGAGPGIAQQRDCPGAACQGGIGDPLTLAASGVLIPFLSGANSAAILQVASPVGPNFDGHMFFFQANCSKTTLSVGMPLTTNDIAFQVIVSNPPSASDPATGNGLVAFAQATLDGFHLRPLDNPIHARMYLFNATDGRSRVLEPIILNTGEFPSAAHWWSPLRTGGTFFAPQQVAAPAPGQVQTDLILICPTQDIQGGTGSAAGQAFGNGRIGVPPFTDQSFPGIEWEFPTAGSQTLRVRVYDTNEVFKRDFLKPCDCVTFYANIAASLNPIYADPAELPNGSYTELTSVPAAAGSLVRTTFTGYTSVFTVSSPNNAFFGRLQNGSQPSIDGALSNLR